MAINPVSSAGMLPASGGLSPSAAPAAPQSVFSRVINQYLGGAGMQQAQANQAVQDLAVGRTDSLHNVLVEVAKADIAFRLVLEIRNRLTDAYQSIMQMQV